jgi:hypothetical protein
MVEARTPSTLFFAYEATVQRFAAVEKNSRRTLLKIFIPRELPFIVPKARKLQRKSTTFLPVNSFTLPLRTENKSS